MSADNPLAQGSRQDLLRLNTWMGNARSMARGLSTALPNPGPRRLTEIGAGDGRSTLRVAQLLPASWRGTRLLLLDRQSTVSPATHQAFARAGWHSESLQSGVFEWLKSSEAGIQDAVVANLFLHHFADEQLRELFHGIGRRARAFLCIEPRRSRFSLLFSHLVGCIGCNRVTRHDAPVSVRAGFVGHELSDLWPQETGWVLSERPAGLFGHLFIARKETPKRE